jgi:hypothetical protein
MDRTPKFNAEISKILENLMSHTRVCSMCKNEFQIDERDIEFLRKFKVPTPKNCGDCRRQIRLSFVNYTTLFKRDCDVPGHTEKMISSIPEGAKFPVYDFNEYWYGYRDWKNFTKDIDLNDSFFKQFYDLFKISPEPSLTRNPANINSDYTSYGSYFKNCYYIFGGLNAENVMFSIWAMNTKNSLDQLISINTDSSYEGVYPDYCYNSNFIYFSKNCIDCNFIHDCRNCNDCFGCVNLRNRRYCIWNEQYSKEDYFKKIESFNLGNKKQLFFYRKKFELMIKSLPIRATRNEHSNNFSGNYIINSKDCFESMWVLSGDNLKYSDFTLKVRDSYDCSISDTSEKMYGNSATGVNCFNVKLSVYCRELRDSEYCINCKNSQYCFGCIGVENAKFCIFNKQYTEDEYWGKVDEIKYKMLTDGEYGEFFPLSLSPFPYNVSLSNIMYSISKDRVLEIGGWWYDDKINIPDGIEIKRRNEIEDDIKDVKDGILNIGIMSEGNGKPFRIVKDELDFYRRKNIAIPNLTPYERIINRFKFVNNFKVFNNKCFKCGIDILSSYSTSEGYKPYCDDCYKKEIY